MPLTKHIQRQRDAIGAFLRAPDARVLSLRTAAELVAPVAKLIASFEKDEELRALFLPHPGPGDDAASFFEAWFSEVRADLEELRGPLAKAGGVFADRAALAAASIPTPDPTLRPGLRAAAWFESLAVQYVSVARSIVLFVVTHPTLPHDIQEELRVLAACLQSRRVRLIAVEADGHVLDDQPGANDRLHVASLVATVADPRPALSRFLLAPAARVLVVPEGAGLLASMLTDFAGVELAAIAVPYAGRSDLEHALLQHFGPPNSVTSDRIAQDATNLERFVRACSARRTASNAGLLVIALDLRPHLQPDKVAAWVSELARQAIDPHVKFIVADGLTDAFLPHLDLRRPSTLVQVFSMGASDIEAGARDLAGDAQCHPERRFQALLTLAGYAAGRQQTAEALRLCDQADAIAATRDLALERALVAVMRGSVHYRLADYLTAIGNYDAGLELATSDPSAAGLVPTLLLGLANSELRRGEHLDAARLYEAVSKLERQNGALVASLYAETWRGEATRRAGDHASARQIWEAVLQEGARFGPDLEAARDGLRAEVLERLSRLASNSGDRARAHRLHEEAGSCGCAIHVPDQP